MQKNIQTVKAEKVSFDKKIDDFSYNIFGIIDDFHNLLVEIFYDSGSPKLDSSNLEGQEYFKYVVNRVVEIITTR